MHAEAVTGSVLSSSEAPDGAPPRLTDVPAEGDGAALLSISGLEKRYGSRPALRGVSATLGIGLTGLLGPNGAGKSTLIRCLAGIQPWDAGEVRMFDHPLEGAGRRQVGYMPETTSFPKELRVDAFLRFACVAKGIKGDWRAEAERKAEAAGIAALGRRIIGTLSKGYRQRLALAQAMLGDPPLLLLDEPVASLDPISVVEIRDAIRAYSRTACVIVSTHQLAEAQALCDRVLILDHGRLAFDGPLAAMGAGHDHDVEIHVLGLERRQVDGILGMAAPGAASASPSRTGDGLIVVRLRDADGNQIGAVVRSLVSAGGDVIRVERTGDSLEGAFAHAISSSAAVNP